MHADGKSTLASVSKLNSGKVNSLINCIDIDSLNFWGDSNIVLAWLKNDQNYKQFVSNRTAEILKLTEPEVCRYCPTDCNPAGIGTRGQTILELRNNSLWFNGPDWPQNHKNFGQNNRTLKNFRNRKRMKNFSGDQKGSSFVIYFDQG